MEGLDFGNIMTEDEVENLFMDISSSDEINEESSEETVDDGSHEENLETTEIDPEDLFSEDTSESVGSEEESQDDQEDSPSDERGSSQKNFYSSIALALHEEGIFPDLTDEVTSNIKSPEDFARAIEEQISAQFDERQRRVDEALNYNVEPTKIKGLETTLNYLESIKDDTLIDESDKGVNIRSQLIYQDYLNRGYSAKRAEREVKKSMDAGTDLEDARDALVANKQHYGKYYKDLIEEGKKAEQDIINQRKEADENLRKSLLDDKKVFGEIQLDKKTRQQIYDNVAKPAYRDEETGQYYTPIQKYQRENSTDFIKNVGLLYTLTNGFKDLEGLVKGKVTREVKKGLRELETKLNNTSRTSGGSLKYISSVNDDPDAFDGKGWDLDI